MGSDDISRKGAYNQARRARTSFDEGEEDPSLARHREIMRIVEANWGPAEPKKRRECAFPECKKTKKSAKYSSGSGAFCEAHSKQKQRHGPEGMAPLGSQGPRAEAWATFKEMYPKAKDTPWRCAWVGCRKRSRTKNALFCTTHFYKWRARREKEDE